MSYSFTVFCDLTIKWVFVGLVSMYSTVFITYSIHFNPTVTHPSSNHGQKLLKFSDLVGTGVSNLVQPCSQFCLAKNVIYF